MGDGVRLLHIDDPSWETDNLSGQLPPSGYPKETLVVDESTTPGIVPIEAAVGYNSATCSRRPVFSGADGWR